MLRQLTGLFADQAPDLSEDQAQVFDAVILRLARNVARDDRVVLSERMADIAHAPCEVVRDLAYDHDVGVAAPVLVRSSRLGDADLVEISRTRGQDHLHCVSRRLTLSERVTDVLLIHGNDRVVGSVAGNRGASFSPDGLDTLTTRARDDPSLRTVLDRRGDGVARDRRRSDGADGPHRPATFVGPQPIPAESGPDTPNFDEAEKQIVAWIGEGRITDALAAIARIAQIPPETVAAAHRDPDYESMMFIVRAIRLGWGTLKVLIQAKPGKSPLPEDLHGAFTAFQALSVTTAQRVVRFKVSGPARRPPKR